MSGSSEKKALKSGAWYTICNFLVRGIGFISTPIFTRVLTQGDIGRFSNMLTWVSLLAIVTTFDLYASLSVARFDFKDELNEYVASNLVLSSTITIFFYGLFLLFGDNILKILGFSKLQLHISFIYLLLYPAIMMFQTQRQLEYAYKPIIIVTVTSAVGSTFISLICALVMQDKFLGRMVGYYIPAIIINLILYIYVLKKAKYLKLDYCKYGLKIAGPMVFHLIAGYILNSSDVIMIRNLRGDEETALYSISYACAAIIQILWSSVNGAWSPWSIEKMQKKELSTLTKAARPFVAFFAFIVFGCVLIAPEILYVMGGESYIVAKYVIPPVMIGYLFQFLYSLYVNIEFYLKKQMFIALGTIIAAATNLVLNLIFIPKYGFIAAAYTTLFSYAILFIIHFVLTTIGMKKKKWYDDMYNIMIAVLAMGVVFISTILYNVDIIRYILLLIITLVVIILLIVFRKGILSAIKTRSIEPIKKELNKVVQGRN